MDKCAYCRADTQLYSGGTPICLSCSEKQRERPAQPQDVHQDIHSVLYQEIIEATARVNSASDTFSSTMKNIPSDLPQPDGTQNIRNVSNRLMFARKAMMRAHSRFNAYLRDGVVPEDLKRKG